MLKTPQELMLELGLAIRFRRIGYQLSQEEAAKRAGMSLSTWKRMEAHGPSSVGHLIDAAITLRCEDAFGQLFPPLAASSMDELLNRQAVAANQKSRKRAPRRKAGA
jgi:transcriptional regulator with XRE-family HTH domain